MNAHRQNYIPRPRRGIRWAGVFFSVRDILVAVGQAFALLFAVAGLYIFALVVMSL